jgi:F-type H+-transporting ATPase subunit delta
VKIDPLAMIYSRALMELARKADRIRPVLEEVRAFAGLFRANRDFRTFLETPSIARTAKREVLERSLRERMDGLVLDFLQVVVDKDRQFLLPQIFEACELLYDQEVGRIHVEAITAVPLEDSVVAAIDKELERRAHREVIVVRKVRPEIMGGMILRYRDLAFDGSVRTALEKIGRKMESTKIGNESIHENQP